MARATITVLAGVNGSGKSSIAGELILDEGAPYYNPDVEAREILAQGLAADQREANSLAWKLGVMGLSRAIDTGGSFTLETTLASSTIRSELERAAYLGTHRLVIWYVGLATVADNIRRVRERHVRGGHDIPVEDIKRRFEISPRNLMRLMEVVTDLHVFDNTAEASVDQLGSTDATPREIVRVIDRRIERALPLSACPQWAQVIWAHAHEVFDGGFTAAS